MHDNEIKGIVEQLERANKLLKAQESRIRFLKNSGEDVASLESVFKQQIERRDRIMRALEIEMKIKEEEGKTSEPVESTTE